MVAIGDSLREDIRGDRRGVVHDLLESGGPVEAKDADGKTLLHIAAKEGNAEMMQLLLRAPTEGDISTLANNNRLVVPRSSVATWLPCESFGLVARMCTFDAVLETCRW